MLVRNHRATTIAAVVAVGCTVGVGAAVGASSSAKSVSHVSRGHVANSSARGKTIELINGDSSDPYFISLAASVKKAAAAAGVHLIVQAPSTFDPTQQVPYMANAVARKVSAIILSADGYQQLIPSLKSAKRAGIPVIIVDEGESDMNNTPLALSFITGNNTVLGYAAGQALAKLIPSNATVLPLNSTPGLVSNQQRVTGFIRGLKKAKPHVKVLGEQFTHDNPTTAQGITTDILKSNPSVKAVYAVDDMSGAGAGIAIEALGLKGKVKLVAVDAEPQEVALLRKGVIQALIAQKPVAVGQIGFRYAVDAITGHKNQIVRNVSPGHFTITRQNMNTAAARHAVYGAIS